MTIVTIEHRLQRLERDNRRLRGALIALVAVASATLLMGAIDPNLPDVVRAKRFQIIGGKELDSVLVDIGPTSKGDGSLVVYNPDGRPLAEIKPKPDGSGWMSTYNSRGYPLIELGATEKGEGAMAVHNGKGYRIVMLRPARDGAGGVMTFNGRGYGLVELGATHRGVGAIKTLDGDGQDLLRIGATEAGQGTLYTFNTSGQAVLGIGASAEGSGEISVFDGEGSTVRQWPVGAEGGEAEVGHVMRARAFEVLDRSGEKVLARFGNYRDDVASLTTYDSEGQALLELGAGEGADGLERYGDEGKVEARWPVSSAGSSGGADDSGP